MLWMLAQFYFFNIPIVLAQIFPMMTLIGAAYCLVEMSKSNEMVALKASGVSLYRIVTPIFVATTVIALLAAANQEWFLPRIGPAIENFSRRYNLSKGVLYDKFGDTEGGLLKYRVHEYDVETQKFRGGVFRRLDGTSNTLKELIEVDEGHWNGNGSWLCRKVDKKTYLEGGERENERYDEYLLHTQLVPDDLLEDDLDPGFRSIRSLRKRIELEPERVSLQLAFHNRFTHPLSALVMLLIGLPPVVGSERFAKNRIMGICLSLVVGGAFWLVTFVCDHLGNYAYIPTPGMAAWLPTIMFGAIGVYLFDTIRT